jgi:excisionase family DNA binding protein
MSKRSWENTDGVLSDKATSATHNESWPPESFVTAQEAANFLAITKRRLLELARRGHIPAHPIGNGSRKTWRFRLSEIANSLEAKGKGQVA